ncbi:calaxin-like [Babylonia areolata]|uniref:calaxin-like n=1 Tax=Babylonia areolata TaxID=304850 RepID=UPI003FD524EE
MGSTRAQIEQKVSELAPKTTLKKKVIHSLVELFNCNCSDKGLDRVSFRDCIMSLFHILDDFILDRLFHTMDVTSNSQHLKVDDFVTGMASLLTEDLDEKANFSFKVYDLNGDGHVTREKMIQFLKNCIVTKSHDADQDDADEGIRELTEMALKKLDTDNDGRVSLEDFRAAVHVDKLRLELLGQCFPDDKDRCQCLKMFGDPDMNAQPVSITAARRDKHSGHKHASACHRRRSASGDKHEGQKQVKG